MVETMEQEIILVAFDATRDITDHFGLEWAVLNVAKPADSLILLAVLPPPAKPPTIKQNRSSRMSHLFSSSLKGLVNRTDQGTNQVSFSTDQRLQNELKKKMKDVCSSMMHQIRSKHNVPQVHAKVKIIAHLHPGSVAMRAKELKATWVILDRSLKGEDEWCMRNLKCNVVVMDNAIPKILRAENFTSSTPQDVGKSGSDGRNAKARDSLKVSSDTDDIFSPLSTEKDNIHQTRSSSLRTRSTDSLLSLNSQTFGKGQETGSHFRRYPRTGVKKLDVLEPPRKSLGGQTTTSNRGLVPGRRSIDSIGWLRNSPAMNTENIRSFMSIPHRHLPPPRCSICKHRMPCMVNGPRNFSFEEIEKATDRFSLENLLAEGGYRSVYKGVLPDGQVIAVKQHRTWCVAKGLSEFRSEVELLSTAQHKNLVTLIGYCVEKTWLLVYEFACNDSLDHHLYGGSDTKEVMNWKDRLKVATGAARGLRYLHEDCRVGCIAHGDFRPKSILLTHDFEAMVGDFGIARCRVDDQCTKKTQPVGAFGYLAPEYMQSRLVTEKADVYSFGVILLELISGSKATHLSRKLEEEGHPLHKKMSIDELLDDRLKTNYIKEEVERMLYAAILCISPNAEQRPRMSKIVLILEGAMPEDKHVPSNYPIKYMTDMVGCDTRLTGSVDRVPPQYSTKHGEYMDDDATNGTLKQSETNSIEEYEAYLRGSLLKFIRHTQTTQ